MTYGTVGSRRGSPRVSRLTSCSARAAGNDFYDVSSDGERFLMVRPVADDSQGELILVQNFFEELKRLVPN